MACDDDGTTRLGRAPFRFPRVWHSPVRDAYHEVLNEVVRIAFVAACCGVAFMALGIAYRVCSWAIQGV